MTSGNQKRSKLQAYAETAVQIGTAPIWLLGAVVMSLWLYYSSRDARVYTKGVEK